MSGSDGDGSPTTKKCGLVELGIFMLAIISGTACSICSKTMMDLHGAGIDGDVEQFNKPIFQTFGMFVGMTFGLVMHGIVLAFQIPFPGYEHADSSKKQNTTGASDKPSSKYGAIPLGATPATEKDGLLKAKDEGPQALPIWMYFFLAIPAVFDLAATALCMMGLQYLDVSIYQLLRGSGIIFVALMKQHVLKDALYGFQWAGVFFNVIAVCLVGGTAILNETYGDGETSPEDTGVSGGQALLGVMLVMAGAVVQSMQFVFEEKVMTMDIPSPPLLLIGMEGLWGTIICLFVVYPMAYYLPGSDHGSYEDPYNTLAMIASSSTIKWSFVIYFFAIFLYNLFAVMVTFLLNSVWHAILDNFRPITVWITDLFIFYVITSTGDFGEAWTRWSYLQLVGMAVLLFGTAVYNAPNAGSIRLEGQWFAFGMDFSKEYKEIDTEQEELDMDDEWKDRMDTFKTRKESSFLHEHSPHVSIHTQALRGLASAKH